MSTPINKSAAKVLKVLKAMRGNSLQGITNQKLCNHLNESPANITRALQTLAEEGLVQQEEDGTYRLSAAMVQMAKSHLQEVERAKARISEFEQRTNVII
ncbi:helix-turn-helix domain-containing protein [Acinetobacter ursingii]|uniref:helix-turn-helix domain-containing protein n=1 Tax=Acinetobacter ursingii TaxID=108980 RepID=UPI0021CDE6DE|nr:helix-turn-helix domain-containing protein [Acinetobacter ursingii]MCU4481243.1 helix-turn-helix domain-containing protein [Acinetobacter ursingii]MCU4505572.1 helix-turn-helix domain-containing protein [Acinetobacter ursingii]MCU4571062.1 helix-turn-helix domain-containing protein [Acinetobacter ursingii]